MKTKIFTTFWGSNVTPRLRFELIFLLSILMQSFRDKRARLAGASRQWRHCSDHSFGRTRSNFVCYLSPLSHSSCGYLICSASGNPQSSNSEYTSKEKKVISSHQKFTTDTDCGVCRWPWQWFALGEADFPLWVTSHRRIPVKNTLETKCSCVLCVIILIFRNVLCG